MASEMVERLAKVLADNAGDGRDYTNMASAVIRAMREASVPMAIAGRRAFDPDDRDRPNVYEMFAVMIDAALIE